MLKVQAMNSPCNSGFPRSANSISMGRTGMNIRLSHEYRDHSNRGANLSCYRVW